jgi:hypothetical protein
MNVVEPFFLCMTCEAGKKAKNREKVVQCKSDVCLGKSYNAKAKIDLHYHLWFQASLEVCVCNCFPFPQQGVLFPIVYFDFCSCSLQEKHSHSAVQWNNY